MKGKRTSFNLLNKSPKSSESETLPEDTIPLTLVADTCPAAAAAVAVVVAAVDNDGCC